VGLAADNIARGGLKGQILTYNIRRPAKELILLRQGFGAQVSYAKGFGRPVSFAKASAPSLLRQGFGAQGGS
jgi:hypothetical protein